jgi:ribonuclease HII
LLHQESAVFATISRDCETINTHGIIKALNFAIQEAIEQVCEKMPHKKFFFLMDGAYLPSILSLTNKNSRCIIKGDGLSLSIAAASILAKVERDTYMDILAKDFPQYQWAQNKGYGTRTHREAITKYGACDHHRALYLRKLLGTTNADHRDTSDVPQKVLSSV